MAKIVFSYDCESKWGMLDHLGGLSQSHFNHKVITQTYSALYELHERHDVSATFAFVGGFTLPCDIFSKFAAKNIVPGGHLEEWIANIGINEVGFDENEWCYPTLIRRLQRHEFNFEIATHGFTHAILSQCTNEELQFEANGIALWAQYHDIDVSTIIFPRNEVNSKLFEYARFLRAYRAAPENIFKGKLGSQIYRLLKELHLSPRCGKVERLESDILSISGDFFINWRHGIRGLIPMGITFHRAKKIIDDAIEKDGVVNFWLHPHNLITGDKQFELLELIVEYVSRLQKNGKILSYTQRDLLQNC